MRSIQVILGAGAIGGAVLLTAPAAYAASAATPACNAAVAQAKKAETDYQGAVAAYKRQVAGGGHPGLAEQNNVKKLETDANATASRAQRECGGH
ncbi:MAG TPA: hypothetical protein VFE65_07795 [Pseudonocardia sp.]|nr:hypothetical protein [Pseudonocardia sp.]